MRFDDSLKTVLAADTSTLFGATAAFRQLSDLIARGRVGYLAGQAHLYVYVSHGDNLWNNEHHRMLADKLSISRALLQRREAQLREGMAVHDLGRSITALGNNGPAFEL